MKRTVRTLVAAGAATAALTTMTAVPAHAQDTLFVTIGGKPRATGYWLPATNQLCVHLVRGYRATVSLGRVGQVHDYRSNKMMSCSVVDADQGAPYRFTLTWVGTNGRAATRSVSVRG